MRLGDRLRAVLGLPGPQWPPLVELAQRVTELEGRLVPLEEALAESVEREVRWQEMNAQLRRYLGRLDAHAGRARQDEAPAANGRQLHPRADVIAAKFPHGLPTKE